MSLKLCFISDTHSMHDRIKVPECDILIHTGDHSRQGTVSELKGFTTWLRKQPARKKVWISGNHDLCLQGDTEYHADGTTITIIDPEVTETIKNLPEDVIYLQDSSAEILGLNFFGSPWTPWFHDWAFNFPPGYDENKHWQKIPDNTDIVLTHGPCWGTLDKVYRKDPRAVEALVGSSDLAWKIKHLRPKIFAFGHIHEGYGVMQNEYTLYINASTCNLSYSPVNKPIIVEIDDGKNIRSWGQHQG